MTKLEGTLTRKQRIEIAKAIIKLCNSRQQKIKIGTGFYLLADDYERELTLLGKGGELTSRRLPPCRVCARGSLLIASVDRFDRCDLSKITTLDSLIVDRTRREWGTEQVTLIEAAFELYDYTSGLPADPKLRLVVIMENIVANNGEFIPSACESA